MRPGRSIILSLAVTALWAGPAAGSARESRSAEDLLDHFRHAVEGYAALHRDIARGIPPVELSADPQAIQQAVDAMADAMRAARPSARMGDIFDDDAASLLRDRIRQALADNYLETADILASVQEGHEPLELTPLAINEPFPWSRGAFMVRCVLDVLPPVPRELQYRFSGRDLVLVDMDAGLVVDVLPLALPAIEDFFFLARKISGAAGPPRAKDAASRRTSGAWRLHKEGAPNEHTHRASRR